MRDYEVTREIFNKCSGNQMRDVFIEELSLDETKLDEYVKNFFSGKTLEIERSEEKGAVVFDISLSGERQRLTFCQI